MVKQRRKLWLKLSAHGREIPVYVVNVVDGDDSGGEYDYENNRINIKSSPNIHEMKSALHHEFHHVFFDGCSGDVRQRVLGPKTVKGRAQREEQIVSYLEPVSYDILVRNGFLKYPDPPTL